MKKISCLILYFIILFNASSIIAQNNEAEKYDKAIKYYNNKEYKDALNILSDLISKNEDNPEYYLSRAKCNGKMGKYQDAYIDFNAAVKYGGMVSKFYFERGLYLSNFPEFKSDAIDNFTMAKNYSDNDSMLYKSLYYRGTFRAEIRDFENAIIDFKNAYKINSKDIYMLNGMALCMNNLGYSDSAIMIFNEAISIDSTFIIGYQNIGFVYSGMEKYEEALKYFDFCVKNDTSPNAYLFNNRGYIKMKMKDYEGALKDINKSLKMDSENSYAYRNRALVYIEMGNEKKACLDLKKALKLNYTMRYGDDVENLCIKYCY